MDNNITFWKTCKIIQKLIACDWDNFVTYFVCVGVIYNYLVVTGLKFATKITVMANTILIFATILGIIWLYILFANLTTIKIRLWLFPVKVCSTLQKYINDWISIVNCCHILLKTGYDCCSKGLLVKQLYIVSFLATKIFDWNVKNFDKEPHWALHKKSKFGPCNHHDDVLNTKPNFYFLWLTFACFLTTNWSWMLINTNMFLKIYTLYTKSQKLNIGK